MSSVTLNGHLTWAQLPDGDGETVVLLHGGLSSSASLLRDVAPALEGRYDIAAFDRRGHGRTADTPEPFSFDAMADETIAFIEFLERRVHLVGHSDGGIVALFVAMRRPDLVRRAVVVGTNYHVHGLMPLPDFTPHSEGFADFAQEFGEVSPDGASHAAAVVEKTHRLMRSQPTLTVDDLATIDVPILVLCGDDDVSTLWHTVSLYESLPESQLAVVPGASHAVLKERTKECTRVIRRFLRSPIPPETLYPLRRAR